MDTDDTMDTDDDVSFLFFSLSYSLSSFATRAALHKELLKSCYNYKSCCWSTDRRRRRRTDMEEDCFVHFISSKKNILTLSRYRNNQGRSLARLALSVRARDTEQGNIVKEREREREFVSS
jgi:hypothetical protein